VLLFLALMIGIVDVSAKTRWLLYAVALVIFFFGGSVGDTSPVAVGIDRVEDNT
jgi:hypothetical protein